MNVLWHDNIRPQGIVIFLFSLKNRFNQPISRSILIQQREVLIAGKCQKVDMTGAIIMANRFPFLLGWIVIYMHRTFILFMLAAGWHGQTLFVRVLSSISMRIFTTARINKFIRATRTTKFPYITAPCNISFIKGYLIYSLRTEGDANNRVYLHFSL